MSSGHLDYGPYFTQKKRPRRAGEENLNEECADI
jgi:hypothetical protein